MYILCRLNCHNTCVYLKTFQRVGNPLGENKKSIFERAVNHFQKKSFILMTSHKENHINILQMLLAFIKILLSPQNHYYSMIASAFGIFTNYKLHIHLFMSFYMAHIHSVWDNDRGTRHS